jgi:2-polyprenyl-3-methyl-5-hydroxy-6-metoxy-1,4-benzoquinol methylase
MKQFLKRSLLAAISRTTRRTAVLLASEASGDVGILSVVSPYRVAGDTLTVHIADPVAGEMRVSFKGIAENGNQSPCCFDYSGPGPLSLHLRDGSLSFAGRDVGNVTGGNRITARRFSGHFELLGTNGSVRRRATSHYLPRDGRPVDDSYYTGEDYVDYEAESEAVHRDVVELTRRHGVEGPVLEIGCATGGTLAALRDTGLEAYGLDISRWAIERARARVGDVAWQCDVEHDRLPDVVTGRGPFKCIVLASVLEHFEHPHAVLAKLGSLAAPGATLIVITTNADSLTHRVLGHDWEGYFDWTHKSVDTVSPGSLRYWLADLGWTTRELRTWHLWDSSGDPTHATLRDWYASDARFRALLTERELGDFITCVAVRA